ncbi:MAG: DUF362 domain-containing protein, partial [Promethearchaeota archaeon]
MVQVSIVRGTDPYETTCEALSLISDSIQLSKISQALLKPNLLMTKKNPIAVTHPGVCAAVADFLMERYDISQIRLAEGTTAGSPPSTLQSMENNGYSPYQDRWTPIDLVPDRPGIWFPILSPGYPHNIELGISKTIINCPYIVSIPKFKTHDVLGLTLSLKNGMGSLVAARDALTKKIIARTPAQVCSYMHGFGGKKPIDLTEAQNIGASKVALATNLLRFSMLFSPS